MKIFTSAVHTCVSSFFCVVVTAFLLSGSPPAPEQELRKVLLLHHYPEYDYFHLYLADSYYCKHRIIGYGK